MKRLQACLEIFLVFLRLGLTSFGGPLAHLGYFRKEFVLRRQWLDESSYAGLVALCQFLPGPASSQVAMALGYNRGGSWGALAAWLGFTAPSSVFLIAFGLWYASRAEVMVGGWVMGLKVLALAVVAQALVGMVNSLCPDGPRRGVALAAGVLAHCCPGIPGQMAVMAIGALCGYLFLEPVPPAVGKGGGGHQDKKASAVCLSLFFVFLFVLPLAPAIFDHYSVRLVDSFYRSGALVFGGGHVVLPLLQAQVVTPGWVSQDLFVAGYGAAQVVPGPLFAFAGYLGAVSTQHPSGWLGGALALVAIFLPSFLLIIGVMPFWEGLRRSRFVGRMMPGVNASVVGILAAAWYDPVMTSAVHGWTDLALAVLAFCLLAFFRLPSWAVAITTVLLGGFCRG